MEAAPKKLTAYGAMEAAREFAALLQDLEYVERVVLEETEWEGLRLWTVLSSPAFEDTYSDPVYEAQGQIIDRLGEPVFDFRVINLNEVEGRLEDVIPTRAHTPYARHIGT